MHVILNEKKMHSTAFEHNISTACVFLDVKIYTFFLLFLFEFF